MGGQPLPPTFHIYRKTGGTLAKKIDAKIETLKNHQQVAPSNQLWVKSASHMLPKHPFGAPLGAHTINKLKKNCI